MRFPQVFVWPGEDARRSIDNPALHWMIYHQIDVMGLLANVRERC